MASISSEVKSRLRDSDSLLSALDALTNMRAFVVLAVTVLAVALAAGMLFGMAGWIAAKSGSVGVGIFLAVLAGLFCWALGLIGVNAAGILLMDEAAGRPARSASDALLASLFTSHRLVMVFLLEFVLFLVYIMCLAIIIFMCKMPGVGPVLYAFVFPLGAVFTGMVIFSLVYVVLPLAAPAVWSGSTVSQIIAMLGLVGRQRLAYVIIMELLLAILAGVLTGFISIILTSGVTTVLGMSGAIVGMDAVGTDIGKLLQGLAVIFMAGGGTDPGSGYVLALGFGMAVLLLCAAIFPSLVLLKGSAIIYLNAISGLQIADAAAHMMGAVDGMKARAQEARERALAAGAAAAASVAIPLAAPAPAPAAGCPSCHMAITPADVFCGSCGHKLQ